MKKLIALLLALVLVALLASCNLIKRSSSKDDDDDNDENKIEDVEDNKDNNEEGDGENNTDTENKPAEKKEFGRGTTAENVYTNTYLGYQFTKPESWIFSTDEEIAAMLNLGAEYLGEKYKEALERNPVVYDMMARDLMTGTNVTVGYENLSKTFATNVTEAQYFAAVKNQLNSVSGMNYKAVGEEELVKIGETEFLRMVCSFSASGANGTQVYYIHKVDSYMAYIIFTIIGDTTLNEVEAMFK